MIIVNNLEFKFDSTDYDGMLKLMKEYGDSDVPFDGTNEYGETVMISICKDSIHVKTFQDNGWIRINVYDFSDDYVIEELFDGKWK